MGLECFVTSSMYNVRLCGSTHLKDVHWSWSDFARNPNVDWDFIKKHRKRFFDTKAAWSSISQNVNITIDIVEKNLDYPWNLSELLKNPNITTEFIMKIYRTIMGRCLCYKSIPVRGSFLDIPTKKGPRISFCKNIGENMFHYDPLLIDRDSRERVQRRCSQIRLELMKRTWTPFTKRGLWLVIDNAKGILGEEYSDMIKWKDP